MECKCGKCLSNSECPNDIEWYIYSEFKNWINKDYFEYTEEQENFDYFWLCPNCKRAYVWLNRNKKYEEFQQLILGTLDKEGIAYQVNGDLMLWHWQV